MARLVLAGADPQRILLLTFSRRAAKEMETRAGRVLHQALGFRSTQRAAGAALVAAPSTASARACCATTRGLIGLDESFTILDRGDAEDLMGLVRQELGLGDTKGRSAFRMKGTCLAIYSRVVNSQVPLDTLLLEHYPWCAQHGEDLKRLFGAYVAEKQHQNVLDFDDLLLYWAEMMSDTALAAARRAPASTMCWSTSTRTPTACRRASCSRSSPTGAA